MDEIRIRVIDHDHIMFNGRQFISLKRVGEMLEEARKQGEPRCEFCGGKLSEIRYTVDGKPYRYCYGCFHEYEVGGCHRRLR